MLLAMQMEWKNLLKRRWPLIIGLLLVIVPWGAVLWLEWQRAQQATPEVVALTAEGPCLKMASGCRWNLAQDLALNIYCADGSVASWRKVARRQLQGAIVQSHVAQREWKLMLVTDDNKEEKGRADYHLFSTDPHESTAFDATVYYQSGRDKLLSSFVACPTSESTSEIKP